MQPQKSIAMELREVSNLLKREMSRNLDHNGKEGTMLHGRVVSYLSDNPDKDIYQRDIEQLLGVQRSTVTKILQSMEKSGFITRESVVEDARLKKLVLTQKAIDVHRLMQARANELDQRLMQNLSNEEVEIFFNLMYKIKSGLQ